MRRMLLFLMVLATVCAVTIAHAGFSPEVTASLKNLERDLRSRPKRHNGALSKVRGPCGSMFRR